MTALDQYKVLLDRLDAFDRADRPNEDPERDAITDQMDGPWWAMTEAERDEARRYSYEISQRPVAATLDEEPT
jgi:hypothetical protein